MFATPLLTLSSSLGISQHALLSNPDDSIRNASIRNDLSSFYPISSTRMNTTNNKAQILGKSTSESESSSTPLSSEDMESDVENLINSKGTAPAIHDSSLCRIGNYCTEVFPISTELPNNEYETMEEVYLKNTPVKDKPVCPLMQSLQKTDRESDGEETEFYDTPTKISHKKEYLDNKFVSANIPFFECEESKYRHVLGAGFTHNRESGDETLCYGTREQPAPESECKVIVRPMPNISCITALENGSFSFKAKSCESNRYLEPPILETMKFHEMNNVEAQVKQNKCSERVFSITFTPSRSEVTTDISSTLTMSGVSYRKGGRGNTHGQLKAGGLGSALLRPHFKLFQVLFPVVFSEKLEISDDRSTGYI
ncbi:hypothetical protein TNCV_4769951 [Trichonephila clavipes]|nr:hypothetical protein TNCV_4769951 [Trichonephila clavipes]